VTRPHTMNRGSFLRVIAAAVPAVLWRGLPVLATVSDARTPLWVSTRVDGKEVFVRTGRCDCAYISQNAYGFHVMTVSDTLGAVDRQRAIEAAAREPEGLRFGSPLTDAMRALYEAQGL
jgi:hypothetical protein